MNRKVFSLLLSAILLVGKFSFVSAESSDIIFYDTFESYPTNGQETSLTITGEGSVFEDDEKNKVLHIETEKNKSSEISVPLDTDSTEFVVSTKILLTGCGGGSFYIKDKAGKSYTLTTIAENGTMYLLNGKKAGGINKGSAVEVAFAFKLDYSRFSIYINGKLTACDIYDEKMVKNAASFSIRLAANKNETMLVDVDDVYVYEGDSVRKSGLPKSEYNSKIIEKTDSLYSEEESSEGGSTVYVSKDFEDAEDGISKLVISDGGSGSFVCANEKASGNGYLKIAARLDAGSIIDFRKKTSKNVIIQMDLKSNAMTGNGYLVLTKDGAGGFNRLLSYESNVIETYSGERVCSLSKVKWTNIAVALNFEQNIFDVYVDGVCVCEALDMQNKNIGIMEIFRIEVGVGSGCYMIDNLSVYDGTVPMIADNSSSSEDKNLQGMGKYGIGSMDVSVFSHRDTAENILGDKTAISFSAGVLYTDGRRIKLNNDVYTFNGVPMIPIREISELFEMSVEWEMKTDSVVINSDKMLTVGSDIAVLSGVERKMEAPLTRIGNSLYMGLNDFAEIILEENITVYADRDAAFFGADSKFYDSEELKRLTDALIYDRPDANQVKQLFEEKAKNKHPRVIIDSDDVERIKRLYKTDSNMKGYVDNLLTSADNLINQPTVTQSNMNNDPLSTARTVRDRTMPLAFAYIMTENESYLKRCLEEVEAVLEFSNWRATDSFLATSEMMGAVAVAYDWMYDALSEEKRSYIEDRLIRLGLSKSYKVYHGTHIASNATNSAWMTNKSNWNTVCNGGTIMAAAAIFDAEPDYCARLLSDAMYSLEYMLSVLYPDGAGPEGYGYWAYAMRYLSLSMETINKCFGTYFGIDCAPGLDTTGLYAISQCGPQGNNNYHDSSSGKAANPYLFWLAKLFKNKLYFDEHLCELNVENLAYGGFYDAFFYDPEAVYTDNADSERDCYFRGVELVAMRSSYSDNNSTYLSYHAGPTVDIHSHVDDGTFVLDMLGERWALDLGPDSYNLETGYFGRYRNNFYRVRAEGHNVLVINPDETAGMNLESVTSVEKLVSKEKGAYSIADLSPAYSEYAEEAKRGYMLGDDRRSVTIRDEIKLKASSDVYWFMHTDAEIELIDNQTAVLKKNGKQIKAVLTTNLPDATLCVMDAKPLETSPTVKGQNENKGIRKLTVKGNGAGDTYIQVKFVKFNTPEAESTPENIFLSNWQIPDGEQVVIPYADSVYSGDRIINGFNKQKGVYTIYIPYGSLQVPKVQAFAPSEFEVKVYQAATPFETSKVTVSNPKEPLLKQEYVLNYQMLPKLSDLKGMGRHQAADVIASVISDATATDNMVVDGDLETRWAAFGEQWIAIDLGKKVPVDTVAVAMWKSESRASDVEIQISDDFVQWETVFNGIIGGEKSGYEYFDTTGRTARYIRLIARGNTENKWNSVLEIAALYNK